MEAFLEPVGFAVHFEEMGSHQTETVATDCRHDLRKLCEVRVEWTDFETGLNIRGTCVNISQSGMNVITRHRYGFAQLRDIMFFLWADGKLLKVKGHIVRRNDGKDLGVEFLFDCPTVREIIGRQFESETEREIRFEVREKEVDVLLRTERSISKVNMGGSDRPPSTKAPSLGKSKAPPQPQVVSSYARPRVQSAGSSLTQKWLNRRITTHL